MYILWQYFSPGVEINIYSSTSLGSGLYGPQHYYATAATNASTTSPYHAVVFLVVWSGIQLAFLYAQSKLGARFFVPKHFLPYRYDYHRPLPSQYRPVYNPHSPTSTTSSGSSSVGGSGNWFGLTLRRNTSGTSSPRTTGDSIYGDIETGSLLTSNQVSEHGANADGDAQHGPECVICYNPIHLNVHHDYMVSFIYVSVF